MDIQNSFPDIRNSFFWISGRTISDIWINDSPCRTFDIYGAAQLHLNRSHGLKVNYLIASASVAACPPGKYGAACRQSCDCQNSAECDAKSGQCRCVAGWTGTNCADSESVSSILVFYNPLPYLHLAMWCWSGGWRILIDSAFYPPWHGKMGISLRAE